MQLGVLRKLDPATDDRVRDADKKVRSRNILIHGHAKGNNEIVWQGHASLSRPASDSDRRSTADRSLSRWRSRPRS